MKKKYSPAAWVIHVFGGVRAAGRAIGRDKASVCIWQRSGLVPTSSLRKILEIARKRGLDITAEDLILGRVE